jgi:hypothetical protein
LTNIFVGKLKQNGKWEWVAAIDTDDGNDREFRPNITTDSCGNVYVAAYARKDPQELPSSPVNFFNAGIDGNTDDTPSGIIGIPSDSYRHTYISKITPNGQWVWVKVVDAISSNEERPQVTVDNCGNIYLAGESSTTKTTQPFFAPQFYDSGPTGSTLLTPTISGRTSNTFQIFVSKIANDPRTQPIIGVVQDVDNVNNMALIEFNGVIDTGLNNLQLGCTYYIDSYGPPASANPNQSKLTTNPCTELAKGCSCPNRCVGVACDESSIVWKVEDPLCNVCVKSKCCCCCFHPERQQVD